MLNSQTGILSQTTRIWVTHQLSHLPECDRIVVLDQGRIVAIGTYKELCDESNAAAHSFQLITRDMQREKEDAIQKEQQETYEASTDVEGDIEALRVNMTNSTEVHVPSLVNTMTRTISGDTDDFSGTDSPVALTRRRRSTLTTRTSVDANKAGSKVPNYQLIDEEETEQGRVSGRNEPQLSSEHSCR